MSTTYCTVTNLKASLTLSIGLIASSALAHAQAVDYDGSINDYGATSCASLYHNSTPPEVADSISDGAIEHCHTNNVAGYDLKYSFADLVSSNTHGPIYAAEILTANNVTRSRGVSRKGITFYTDPSIPYGYQGSVRDYVRSGYDRGHMANWADGANPQTFELSNIVPQDTNNNRQLWEKIEVATRGIALQDGDVYVISGPIYRAIPARLKNASPILVPDRLFKCVNSASYHGCYEVNNGPGWDYVKVSYKQITLQAGVNPFPADAANEDVVDLPNPKDGRVEIAPVGVLSEFHAGPFGSADAHVGRYAR